jgi:peptidoglycan hydrolase-like protein with peptidoglycan-binding domain
MAVELHYRDVGTDVRRLQIHLREKMNADLSPDGNFGPNTRNAVIAYQRDRGVGVSGMVDDNTSRALERDGLVLRGPLLPEGRPGVAWPPPPANLPQPTSQLTESLFGRFDFSWTPEPRNPEHITIHGSWEADNIVSVHIPQLDNCLFDGDHGYVVATVGQIRCHKLAAPHVQALFAAWEGARLLDRVLTYNGAFVPRLKRGSTRGTRTNLSNHAWGTAFDIDADLNPLGHTPLGLGARGCVRELVRIANEHGFYWGGHFGSRPDGMHFELSKL